jgi:acyl carrier protein
MDKTGIITTLQSEIASQILNLPQKKITPQEPLISSGLVDSFSLVDLAMLVEDSFNVRIDDTELNSDTFDTIEQLAEIIISRI